MVSSSAREAIAASNQQSPSMPCLMSMRLAPPTNNLGLAQISCEDGQTEPVRTSQATSTHLTIELLHAWFRTTEQLHANTHKARWIRPSTERKQRTNNSRTTHVCNTWTTSLVEHSLSHWQWCRPMHICTYVRTYVRVYKHMCAVCSSTAVTQWLHT